eukprot:scaffold14742_cov114-Isochrysis_galbana.AAC.2
MFALTPDCARARCSHTRSTALTPGSVRRARTGRSSCNRSCTSRVSPALSGPATACRQPRPRRPSTSAQMAAREQLLPLRLRLRRVEYRLPDAKNHSSPKLTTTGSPRDGAAAPSVLNPVLPLRPPSCRPAPCFAHSHALHPPPATVSVHKDIAGRVQHPEDRVAGHRAAAAGHAQPHRPPPQHARQRAPLRYTDRPSRRRLGPPPPVS